jgi:hypothetical protein
MSFLLTKRDAGCDGARYNIAHHSCWSDQQAKLESLHARATN